MHVQSVQKYCFSLSNMQICDVIVANLILLFCKTWAIFCHSLVHQHGRVITWVKTMKSRIFGTHFASQMTWDNREMIAETRSTIPRLRSPRLRFFNILFFQKRDSYSNSKSCRVRSDPFGWKFDDEPNTIVVYGVFIVSVNLSRLSLISKYQNYWKFCVQIACLFHSLYHNWQHIPSKKVKPKKNIDTSEFGNSFITLSWTSRQAGLFG